MTAASTRSKTFRFVPEKPREPLILDLDGIHVRCSPELDGLTLMEFSHSVTAAADIETLSEADQARVGLEAAGSFLSLLQAVVLPEDWDLFRDTVRKQRIPLSGLAEIARWLVEEYSDRPIEPS
jgi:hypothetical protein